MIELAPSSETRMTYDEAILNLFMCKHDNKKDWRLPTEYEYYYGGNAREIQASWYKDREIAYNHDVHTWHLTPVRDIKFVYISDITCYNNAILFNKRYR